MSLANRRVLSFDVESLGLHGLAWAVGWVYFEADGTEIESGIAACSPGDVLRPIDGPDDLAWVQANCPTLPRSCSNHAEVRAAFWRLLTRLAKDVPLIIADCAWPVEARFLSSCVDVDLKERRWLGPYPLHDVATMRLAAGLDPLATVDRLPLEEPKHHPTADARQSGRLWFEAINILKEHK